MPVHALPSSPPAKRFPWIAYAIILAGITLAAAAPLLSALAAGAIANAYGCHVDEGRTHPCIVHGSDLGEMLYTMFVAGWLMFLTVPAGAVAFLLWVVAIAIHLYLRRRRRAAIATAASQA